MAELLNAANRARTALSGAITATATSFSVEDASSFPKPPFAITVEDEIMEVGTVSGNTFSNVTRGLEGTVAVAHEQGAPVENRFTAGTYNRMVDSFNEQKLKVAKVEHELNDLKGVLQQVNINLAAHKAENMPHQFINHKENKTYKFGFQLSAEGNPQIIFEEVV